MKSSPDWQEIPLYTSFADAGPIEVRGFRRHRSGEETIEPFAFFDPDLLKQAADAAKPVQVTESSKQTINVSAFR